MNRQDAEGARLAVVELLSALQAGDESRVRRFLTGQLADDTLLSHVGVEFVRDRLGIASGDLSRVVVAPRVYPRHDGSAIVPVTAAERADMPASGVLVTQEGGRWMITGLARLDTSADAIDVGWLAAKPGQG